MASPHRKLFPKRPEENSTTSIIIISPPPSITPTTVETCINFFCDPLQNDTVEGFCPKVCLALCPSICIYSLPDPLSPPPQPNKSHNLSPLLISMLIILAFLFVIITFYIVYTKIYPYFNNNTFQTRPRSWRGSDDNNTLDEEQHGMAVLFHPIWYIPTVGLNPSVINSITVQTYQRSSKGGVHVDGSDCAVCLAEFQDGDNLRVLPKCNHAFHLPCIDTWLRSHTNCPLCRAPVVVPDSDNQTVVNSSTPPLGGVDVSTVDHDDHDRDDDQRIIVLRRSSSFDGNIENNKKEITMNSGGNKETGSSSSRHERGPVGLVGRSFSCTAKIFSSRYNNNNNNNNNNDQ